MAVRINGPRLRDEIAARGLTQGEFAKQAGVSANTLSSAIQGRPVQQVVLLRLVTALRAAPAVKEIAGLIAERVPLGAA